MRVSLAKTDRSFSVAAGRSVLDAARGAGFNLQFSCKSGNCGACRARLLAGNVHYPHGEPLGLSAAEARDGWILCFRYVAVLSERESDWVGRRGCVHEAVLQDLGALNRYDIYAAGPPAMIAAVRREFLLRGAVAGRLFSDSFDYAADISERQRSRATTRS